MYKNGFVLTVTYKGSPVRESVMNNSIHDVVTIPFGDDYQLRVKNKTSNRAMFELFVDGANINTLGKYIINAGESVTLDRFMGSSLDNGKKFKFVSANDSKVSDPTSDENGVIELKAWKEKVKPVFIGSVTCIDRYPPMSMDWSYRPSLTMGINDTLVGARSGNVNNQESLNLNVSNFVAQTPEQAGATIEGGHSDQSFSYGVGFEIESYPTVISLKMVGPKRALDHDEVIVTPRSPAYGPKRTIKNRVKFCGNCGNERNRFDKFCPDCGRAYVKHKNSKVVRG